MLMHTQYTHSLENSVCERLIEVTDHQDWTKRQKLAKNEGIIIIDTNEFPT